MPVCLYRLSQYLSLSIRYLYCGALVIVKLSRHLSVLPGPHGGAHSLHGDIGRDTVQMVTERSRLFLDWYNLPVGATVHAFYQHR